jgi:outer membrane protein OmpA-like peptidoglycan-associated protein
MSYFYTNVYSVGRTLSRHAVEFVIVLVLIILASEFVLAQGNVQIISLPVAPADAPRGKTEAPRRINLGAGVNSAYSDLFPVITPDEAMLFFVRKGSPENTGFATRESDEDIWYTLKQADGSWSKAIKLGAPLNTEMYDGVRAMNSTADRIYLQNTYNPDGTRGKGFSMSTKQADGKWAYPESLEIDDYYNDTSVAMMAVSNDEQSLILAVQRKDSKGQHDLYYSKNLGGLKWSRPVAIEALNTPLDELTPFIAYDDRTVYFSTNGRGGYGLHDVFMSRRLDDTWQNWSDPVNLGPLVNTPSFDAYFTLSASGDTAYVSSAHETSTRGFGKGDLWKMGLERWQQPGFDLPSADLAKMTINDIMGANLRLENVLFDVGKTSIREISKPILIKLAQVMLKFPQLNVEVQGHTDNDGPAEMNLRLSRERAQAVRAFVVQQGVSEDRVDARGYGMTKPIAPNTTLQGKQLNRRVMVVVKGTSLQTTSLK